MKTSGCVASVALSLLAIAPVHGADPEFEQVENLAHDFYVQQHPDRARDVKSTYVGQLVGQPANSLEYEFVADVTLRLTNDTISRIQLYKKGGRWAVARELAADTIAEAHPLVVDEIIDEGWRESERLRQHIALELEARLRREERLSQVRSVYPRCFVTLKYGKALCDISYATWTSDSPECFDRATLFERRGGKWLRASGDYHPGHRIHPDTGLIFQMEPRRSCGK